MSDKKHTNKPDEPTFFVSRRGRQVGINQVDLKGIDIESEQPATQAKPGSASKAKTKRAKKKANEPKQGRIILSRRKLLVVALVLLGVMAIPVSVGEAVAAQYRDGIPTARAELSRIVDRSVKPLQQKPVVSAEQIRTVANDIDGIVGSMCRGGMLDNIASLYHRADAALKNCRNTQADYAALAKGLRMLEGDARYLERVDDVLKTAATPITDEYAVIAAQHDAWQRAADALKELSPPNDMRSAHEELSKHTSAIANSWSQLGRANSTQDAAAFMEAEKTLATAYEAVRSVSGAFDAVIADTQAQVTTSYLALQ